MITTVPLRGYRFGNFELDLATGELRRRGLKVRLRGRPIDILMLLLERGGEVVPRDELRTRLWTPDTFVDFDHGLNSAMNKLRDALNDGADNPRFIETIPRRGYRFIAPIEVLAPAPPASAASVATAPNSIPDEASARPSQPPPASAGAEVARAVWGWLRRWRSSW
jgi:cholera toxin transcriptional activator